MFVILSSLAALLALIRPLREKGPYLCPYISYTPYFNKCLLSYFQETTFPLNSVLQIDAITVSFDLFLNLGFYYIKLCPSFLPYYF